MKIPVLIRAGIFLCIATHVSNGRKSLICFTRGKDIVNAKAAHSRANWCMNQRLNQHTNQQQYQHNFASGYTVLQFRL